MSLLRKALLAGSTSPWLREQATKAAFVRRSVSRFMPGERLDDALSAAATLAGAGSPGIFTKLGENVSTEAEADAVAAHYLEVIARVAAAGLDVQISVKPTQLGLDLGEAICRGHLRRLAAAAEQAQSFLWIDMESSPYVDPTLALYRDARTVSRRVGLALQAYLRRTPADLEALLPEGPAVRFVKGAYLEPASVAFPDKRDVDDAFFRLACRMMEPDALAAGSLLHMGTHDPVLCRRLLDELRRHQVPAAQAEFAMLYGIQRGLQLELVRSGWPMRVLVAYGEYWFPWYMRRLAERPANIWFVLRNLAG